MRLTAAFAAVLLVGLPSDQPGPSSPARDSARHVLNRLAFGPAPGQMDEVAEIGALRWVDQQLERGTKPEAGLVRRLDRFELARQDRDALARAYRELLQSRLAQTDTGPERATRRDGNRAEFRQLLGQLPAMTTLRATVGEQQLLEVMTDFWFNHFNVDARKFMVSVYLPDYLETTIRRHAFDRFETLLLATARHPAMLLYLDQARSVAPGTTPPGFDRLERLATRRFRSGRQPDPERAARIDRLRERMPTGLNENYARELLELHTLGVDGGYTQDDVVAVARILTGWGIDRERRRGGQPGGFGWHAWAHDRGEKTVLGVSFPAGGGEEEGQRLLSMLARHPATIHHVSGKLCARLVADQPPDGCVDAAARAWTASDGSIAEVIRAIVRTPEFWAAEGVKTKTPVEFVISAARILGVDPDTSRSLARATARLGQPLYLESAPTGYPEAMADWVNSGALLARMNFATALAGGTLPGLAVDLGRIIPDGARGPELVAAVDEKILGGRMAPTTHAVIAREIASLGPEAARAMAVALALGGPEFQRQ